jgi:RNA polymerase sigma-70 factor, ECF subfamily
MQISDYFMCLGVWCILITSVERIWGEFNIPLKDFIRRRVKNDQDVEDILQTVFYKIYNNVNNLNEVEKIHAWIYCITKNTIVDFYRVQKKEVNITGLSDDIIDEVQEENCVNLEIAQCLKTMIQFLPEKYKQAIMLTEFENLTQKELGDRLGLSVSGAKSRIQRARIKLKEMLLSCCYLEFDRLGNVIDYKHKCSDCKYC